MSFTPEVLKQTLRTVDTDATRQVEQNADLLNLFASILNGSLAALDGKTPSEIKISAILGGIDKNASLAGFVGKVENSKNFMVGSAAVQLSSQTLTLLKLGANATPGQVLATVGAVFTKKVALAMGLAENDKQAKLIAAFSDCASSFSASKPS